MKQVEFFEAGAKCKYEAVRTIGGWLLRRNVDLKSDTLETARGSQRVFKDLSTVSKVCGDNGVKTMTVIN